MTWTETRDQIAQLLKDDPTQPNLSIAKQVGCGGTTVWTVRKSMGLQSSAAEMRSLIIKLLEDDPGHSNRSIAIKAKCSVPTVIKARRMIANPCLNQSK